MSTKRTTPITLAEIAEAIKQHALLGTFDVDYLNACLWPTAKVTFEQGNADAYESNGDATAGCDKSQPANMQAEKISCGSRKTRKRPSSRDRSKSEIRGQVDGKARQISPTALPQNDHISADTPTPATRRGEAQREAPSSEGTQPTDGNAVQSRTRKRRIQDTEQPRTDARGNYTIQTRSSNDRLPQSHSKLSEPSPAFAAQYGSESLISARKEFIGKWVTKSCTVSDWKNLNDFTYIGKRPDQAPFQVLDFLMTRLCEFGSLDVLTAFKCSVEVWISKQTDSNKLQIPEHLVTVDGFDAMPFQRFWKANQLARNARGAEGIAIILRRKAIVDQLAAYEDVIRLIRVAIGDKRIKLRHGEIAASKARDILFNILYKDIGDRGSMRNLFEYDRTCALPYHRLCEHYGNQGIIAMVPLKVRESDFQAPARPPAMAAILDVLRPDFHGPNLALYSKVITMVAAGQAPTSQIMTDLNRWSTNDPESLQ